MRSLEYWIISAKIIKLLRVRQFLFIMFSLLKNFKPWLLRLKKEQEFVDQTEKTLCGKGKETKEVIGGNAVEAETEETGVAVGRGNGDGKDKEAEAGTEIGEDTVEKETLAGLGVGVGRDAEIGV